MQTHESANAKIAELEAALTASKKALAELEKERDLLKASHERLRLELDLMRRRMFVAKAERVDTTQLKLDFAEKLRALEEIAGTLGMPADAQSSEEFAGYEQDDDSKPTKSKRKPRGRRDLRRLPLEEKRIEIEDPVFERLVFEKKAERIGFEESHKLAWQRGGMRRLTVARVKYRTTAMDELGDREVALALKPKELFWRCLAAPSLLAHIAVEKFCDGMPLFRIEERFARDGVSVDRGTMSRWMEDLGATLGATVVHAMRKDVLRNVFCIATDATGVAVQPAPAEDGHRQPCHRGHYFVMVADRDAVFFDYVPRETSVAVEQLFEGFSGYVQADAKSVYDALFETPEEEPPDGESPPVRHEVACWSHARRHFWEATAAKSAVAREGLARIGRIFELDATWKGRLAEDVKRLRDAHLRPHVDAFFAWAEEEFEKVRGQRGLLRSALGYAVRQRDALCRFLEDGRLLLDNNRSERALRKVAVGRKAWLFAGSDEHAVSAGHLFTLIASARLHNIEPEGYLRDLIRVLPHWPADRHLELSPMHWAATRQRLNAGELANELGALAVPKPAAAPEQQSAPR